MTAENDTPDGYQIVYVVRYDSLNVSECDIPPLHTDQRVFGSYAAAVTAAVESGFPRFTVDRLYLKLRGTR